MANSYKILAQSSPTASTLTPIYTVPASTQSIISTILVCNNASTAETVSIATTRAGVTATTSMYAYRSVPIAANDTLALTIGATLDTTDSVRINPSTGAISVQLFGSEIT